MLFFLDSVCSHAQTKDVIVNGQKGLWNNLSDNFNEDLTNKKDFCFDIVKVEIPYHPYCFMEMNHEKGRRKTIWEEKQCKEVTMAEVEQKFGCKVKIVKENDNDNEN